MKNRLASSAAAAAPSSGLLLSATLLLALSSLPLPARAQFDDLIAALPFECQDGGYAFVECVNNNLEECGLPCAGTLGPLAENIPGEYASPDEVCSFINFAAQTLGSCCGSADCVALLDEVVVCAEGELCSNPSVLMDALFQLPDECGGDEASKKLDEECGKCVDDCEGALVSLTADGTPDDPCLLFDNLEMTIGGCCANAECLTLVSEGVSCIKEQIVCDGPGMDFPDKTDGDDGGEEKNILDGTSQMGMVFGTTNICQAENDAVNACFQSNISKCEQCLLDFVNFLSKNGSQNADINCEKGTTAICDVLDCCDNCAEKLEDFIKCAQENTQDMIDGGETCQVKCSGGESGRYVAWAAFAASAVVAGLGILAI